MVKKTRMTEAELEKMVKEVLATLTPRKKALLEMLFGIHEDRTLEEEEMIMLEEFKEMRKNIKAAREREAKALRNIRKPKSSS